MSEAAPSAGGGTSGTEAAVAAFLAQSPVAIQYLLPGVVIAAIWWRLLDPMSAFAAGLGLVVLSLGAPGVLGALRWRRWPATEAVVAESRVLTAREALEYAGDGADRSGPGQDVDGDGYVPFVRYEYTVDGVRYETAGISPFDAPISRRRWAAAIVDRHPTGAPVTVRYDPAEPTRAYLRPWVRSKSLVFSGLGFVFLAIAVWFAAGVPGGAPTAAMGVGVPLVALGLARLRTGLRSRNWPTTPGIVTATDVAVTGGGDDTNAKYVPDLAYEYTVDGTSYVGSRYGFSGPPKYDSRSAAREWIESTVPAEADVRVHYDPGNPDVGVLEPGPGRSPYAVAIGLAFVGLGLLMLLS